jgi:hypothetical protein
MSGEEERREELEAFEAALASLRPKGDRLDPRWRGFLAKQASLTAAIASGQAPELLEAMSQGHAAADGAPLCPFCGRSGPTPKGVRRWGWPAAFAAMTTVAATLLVMLASRPGRQVAGGPGEAARPAASQEKTETVAKPSHEATPTRSEPAARTPAASHPPKLSRRAPAAPYPQLRDKVMEQGFDAWETPPAGSEEDWQMAHAPLSSRELLDRLLNEARPSNPPPSPVQNPSNSQEPDHDSA